MKRSRLVNLQTIIAASACLAMGAREAECGLTFSSTNDASQWQVSTHVGGTDGLLSSFNTTSFVTATAITGRVTGTTGWIANNSTGTNGPIGDWTFFVFRQKFDLTGYDPSTVDLKFQWAADDSGLGVASQGNWTPKYSLNGGSLIPGTWPGGQSYSFGPTVDLSGGFVSGVNEIDFYVEGNGVTDGFALNLVSITANPSIAPEPSSLLLVGIAAASSLRYFGWRRRPTDPGSFGEVR